MTADHPLSGLLRLAIIIVGIPWALAMSAFVLIACATAQAASLLASGFIFLFTWRWSNGENVITHVACPRLATIWQGLGDLWPRKAPRAARA